MGDLHEKLVYNKLDEICFNLATYFNYLIIPRTGYFIVGSEDNTALVKPVIDLNHIAYLLNEIYPCSEFNSKVASKNPLQFEVKEMNGRKVAVEFIPKKFKKTVTELLRKYINGDCLEKVDDPDFKLSLTDFKPIDSKNVEIHSDVYHKIYNFYHSYKLVIPDEEEDIKNMQLKLINKRTDQKYGFNLDVEDTAFQSMIYVITALVDSLSLKTVGINEVMTALNILIPKDLHETFVVIPRDDEGIRKIINDAFNSKGLSIDMTALQLLTNYMQKVNTLSENVFSYEKINPLTPNARILNRLMGFSSFV